MNPGSNVLVPTTLEDALAAIASHPDATVIAGGTDLMPAINEARGVAASFISLRRVPELRGWSRDGDQLVIGAGTRFSDLVGVDIEQMVPILAQAARTVGSPQIRNAGTVGGNLCTASPAGDLLPVLTALDAEVQLRDVDSESWLPLTEFVTGVKATCRQPGQLVTAVRFALRPGPQEFLKVGTRNAMVISVASVAVCLDESARQVRVAAGAVSQRPSRQIAAEEYAAELLISPDRELASEALDHFGELVASGCDPIDDHRASARYRLHAVAVCARRALARVASASTSSNRANYGRSS